MKKYVLLLTAAVCGVGIAMTTGVAASNKIVRNPTQFLSVPPHGLSKKCDEGRAVYIYKPHHPYGGAQMSIIENAKECQP